MEILIKSFIRGMATGIFIPIAMLFNSYLLENFKNIVIFNTPNWYMFVHLILFFPLVGILHLNTSLPLNNYELVALCTAITANGFLYAIVFVFIKKVSHLFQQLMQGEI